MEDSPGTTRQEVAEEPQGLLATKLHLPRTPPRFVPRQRLLDQLEQGLDRDLTLVSAPAGFGKTALLADWCREQSHPIAWLSVDDRDNDPVRFWRHLGYGLDGVRPGLFDRMAPLVDPPGPPSFDVPVSEVVNSLDSSDQELLLVVDDYHLIDDDVVHESMRFLLEHRPDCLHLVLASRTDPPLPLARLRAGDRLTEIGTVELRFDTGEAAEFLREAIGTDLSADIVAQLVARTEGWPVGLQLAGLLLVGQPDVAEFVESFSGSHRYVLDYLTEEVLEQQPEDLRTFMLETSVLERLSGPLCDAVTGRRDGQRMLETIESANLFLTPLDDVRGWWRYHQLFSDSLRSRLEKRQPARSRELHRMAGRWHEEHGAVDDALRHALAADDPEWSGDLLERHFDALYLGSRGATVERWLSALPEGLVDSRPRLLLARARMAYLGGEVETAGDLLDSAERALEAREGSVDTMVSSPPNEVAATIAVERAIIANQRGDPDAGARFASEALGEVGDGQSMVGSLARWQLGLSDWLRGRLIDASSSLDSSARHWEQQGDLTLAAWSCQYRGQVLRARGDLDSAVHVCRKALDVASPPGRTPHPAAGVAHVGMAEVAYERAELDAAERHLADGLPLCRRFVYNQPLAIGWATQARIRQARGDPAGARSAMEQAQEIADPGVADVLTPVMALRARLMLAQGHSAAVAAWTSERQLDAEDRFEYPQEAAYLVLLRLLLARKEIDAALHLADRLHASALSQDRSGSLIEIQALRALGLAASGDETAALSELAGAFTLAAPQGYVRVFIDEGWPMAELLGRFIAAHSRAGADVPPEYLGLLVRNFERAAGDDDAAPVVPELVVQLSSRELEVLGKVAEGMTNREIADELYVSLHTVKKHITHILEKLGASNRTEATTRARELGLVA